MESIVIASVFVGLWFWLDKEVRNGTIEYGEWGNEGMDQ